MPVRFRGYGLNIFPRLRMGRLRESPPACVEIDHCICLPLTAQPGPGLRMSGGVYHRDGGYVIESGMVTSGKTVVGAGNDPLPVPRTTLAGRSLYLGVAHYHYGHLLVETLSRLWCFDRDQLATFDHVLLMPLNGHVAKFVTDILGLLGIEEKLHVVTQAVNLDAVCIPAPSIEYPGTVHRQVAGIPPLFSHVCTLPKTDQPLFLSRTAVTPGHHRATIGEDRVEQCLAAQGVRIFHPQRHSVAEQIITVNSHRTLIGFGGSALHTLIAAGGQKQVFAYSAREIPPVFPLLDMVLGNEGCYINAKRGRLPGQASLTTGFGPQLLDPRPILRTLHNAGVIHNCDTGNYGSDYADAVEVRRYNTALLLRRILEASQSGTDDACFNEIQEFTAEYTLDPDMLALARSESALLRRFFPR